MCVGLEARIVLVQWKPWDAVSTIKSPPGAASAHGGAGGYVSVLWEANTFVSESAK